MLSILLSKARSRHRIPQRHDGHGVYRRGAARERFPLSAPNAREKLSGSAAALFQRFGYARVSIRDITSPVDIPKGAFYNHFKSKEALASAVLSQHFDVLLETLVRGGSE